MNKLLIFFNFYIELRYLEIIQIFLFFDVIKQLSINIFCKFYTCILR